MFSYLLAWLDSLDPYVKRVVVALAWIVTARYAFRALAFTELVTGQMDMRGSGAVLAESAVFVAFGAIAFMLTNRWWGSWDQGDSEPRRPLSAWMRGPHGRWVKAALGVVAAVLVLRVVFLLSD